MIKVKLVTKGRGSGNYLMRQTPGNRGELGSCQFVMDPDSNDYDWLVVYDDLPSRTGERYSMRTERLPCSRRNTIFVMAEPSSIKVYGYDFLNQFGTVVSCHGPEASPSGKTLHTIPGLIWFHGMSESITYDQMKTNLPLKKTSVLSTVYSAKSMKHTLHEKRMNFTLALKDFLPELDIFGRGFRPLDDKSLCLDSYKYHVAMENTIYPNYISEKITDSFLGLSLPFYVGAPNVSDYFPEESYIRLDPDKPKEAADIIREAIRGNAYEERLPALLEARRRVMDEYNLFSIAQRIIEARNDEKPLIIQDRKPDYIYSRRAFVRRSPWVAVRLAFEKWPHAMRHMAVWFKRNPGRKSSV